MEKDASSQDAGTRAVSSPRTTSGGEAVSSASPKKRRKVNHGTRAKRLGCLTFDTCADTQPSMHLLPAIGEPQHPNATQPILVPFCFPHVHEADSHGAGAIGSI